MIQRDISVAIADDHHLFREALAHLLGHEEGFSVVAQAAHGQEAIQLVLEHDPDVLLLDIVMPVLDGIQAAREIHSVHPRTEIVILTGHRNEAYQREAFEAGARGYLFKDCSPRNLLEAIRAARRGDYYLAGEAGETSGALVTRSTIARWRPRHVLLVGIAGGLSEKVRPGDVVGLFDDPLPGWNAPDASIDVATDVLAALDKFAGLTGAPSKTQIDLIGDLETPAIVDHVIDIADVVMILDAFRGDPYPFTPSSPPPCQ